MGIFNSKVVLNRERLKSKSKERKLLQMILFTTSPRHTPVHSHGPEKHGPEKTPYLDSFHVFFK